MGRRCLTVSLLAMLCLSGAAAAAFRLEPSMVVFKASVREKMTWVDVVHDGGPPMAIELSILNRALDINGEPVHKELIANKDFTIYPSRIILRPKERRRVQMIYNSKRRVNADEAYFLFAKEVPLPVTDEADDVRMNVNTLMNYYVIVAFDTEKPGKLAFVSSKALGNGMVELVVENKGGGRVAEENLTVVIGGREKIREFTGLKNSIMPGQQRRLTFKYGRVLTAKDVKFEYAVHK